MNLLVTWLWQGLAVAFATAVLLSAVRRLSASTRHVCWWLSILAVLSMPAAYAAATSASPAAFAATEALPSAENAVPLPAVPGWLSGGLAVLWLSALVLGGIRVMLSVRAVRRLKRDSRTLDPEREGRLPVWSTVRATGRQPCLRVSDAIEGACALGLGLGRPVILLSRTLVDGLSDRELDGVVVHERAHLDRYDDWTRLAEAVISAVAGLHPAVWFIGRRIRFEREAACDDDVVMRTGAPRDYARSLIQVATASGRFGAIDRLAIPGMVMRPSALGRRVRRLLDPARDRGDRLTLRAAVTGAALLVTAVAIGARTPAVVVFVETAVERPPLAIPAWLATNRRAPRIAVPQDLSRVAPAPSPMRGPSGVDNDGPAQPEIAGATLPAPYAPAPVPEPERLAPPAPIPLAVRVAADRGGPMLVPGSTTVSREIDNGGEAPPPWVILANSATSTGQGVARAGATTGVRARDAGVSIGRFFTRAGKSVAGSF
jgi:beta-lactamase regulating signal transducer with metallopeptidase domain